MELDYCSSNLDNRLDLDLDCGNILVLIFAYLRDPRNKHIH